MIMTIIKKINFSNKIVKKKVIQKKIKKIIMINNIKIKILT